MESMMTAMDRELLDKDAQQKEADQHVAPKPTETTPHTSSCDCPACGHTDCRCVWL